MCICFKFTGRRAWVQGKAGGIEAAGAWLESLFPHAIQCVSMQTAEVVIIGGGIVGSSIAYHLTAAGCADVLVIERETAQGKGSTGKSMGGVRAQFLTPVNIQVSLYSIPFYASFDERLGHPAGY